MRFVHGTTNDDGHNYLCGVNFNSGPRQATLIIRFDRVSQSDRETFDIAIRQQIEFLHRCVAPAIFQLRGQIDWFVQHLLVLWFIYANYWHFSRRTISHHSLFVNRMINMWLISISHSLLAIITITAGWPCQRTSFSETFPQWCRKVGSWMDSWTGGGCFTLLLAGHALIRLIVNCR